MANIKWYASPACDESPVISSRVRLARNLKKYPFSVRINNDESGKMVAEVVNSLKNDRMAIGESFQYVDLSTVDNITKTALVEKHAISTELLKYQRPKAVLIKDDESVDIMINEEDHIRIQAIYPGNNVEAAYDLADKIDNLIGESLEYAYHKDFGYLTSCPSNTGTGLRASVMLHLPMLESTGNLQSLIPTLAKLGMTIRGLYGEGSKSLGSIYQVSNQVTLGKNEEEIISSLSNVTKQIVENEYKVLKAAFTHSKKDMEDSIYRAYGILGNARKISLAEAMNLLSAVRLGYTSSVIKKEKPDLPFYSIMMNIEPGNLQKTAGGAMSEAQMNVERANYLRGIFGC